MAGDPSLQAMSYALRSESKEWQEGIDQALRTEFDEKTRLDCSAKLTDAETWQKFTEDTRTEIAKVSEQLRGTEPTPSPIDEEQLKAQRKKLFAEFDKLNRRTHAIDAINAAMQEEAFLQELVLTDEIDQYHSEFAALEDKTARENFLKDDSKPDSASLRETVAKINKLKKERSHANADAPAHDDFDTATESLETLVDTGNSADEIVTATQININNLDIMSGQTGLAATSTAAAETMAAIPLVSEFLRAWNYLRDAYHAYKDPTSAQRNTRIGAGIFGGSVTLGSFTVGALLLGKVGLLATATAAVIAPITIAAVAFGVCAVALYRDSYILHQAQIQKTKIENKLDEIAKLENEAKEKISKNVGIPLDTNHIRPELNEAFQRDPRLTRLSIDKTNLTTALIKLNESNRAAKRNLKLSTASLIAFGLALTAICATGVGAIAVSLIATATFLTVAGIRAYHIIQAKRASNAQKKSLADQELSIQQSQEAQITARRTLQKTSSELRIAQELSQDHPQGVANSIIGHSAHVTAAAAANANAALPKLAEEKEADAPAQGETVRLQSKRSL